MIKAIATNSVRQFRVVLAAALVACSLYWVTGYADETTDAIRALRAQSNEAIARHDVEAIRSFLSDDFVISVSTGSIERSRDEHISSFARFLEQYPDAIFVRMPDTVTASDGYPLAIEQGRWVGRRTSANGEVESGGEYTAAWKLISGEWKIYSELYVALYCRGEDC